MNILITGSSGYIGSTFIKTYNSKYTFIPFSLQSDELENINFEKVDVVLHCAGLVHQKTSLDYSQYSDINVTYPLNLALLAKKYGVKQFVFISTIAVHGETFETINELTPCIPTSSYGKSKLEAEKQLSSMHDSSFTVSIIRLPMVYGKNAHGNIASLIKLIKKTPLLPFGDISNCRSFIYIDNLCHWIDTIITKNKNGIFLISDNESFSTTKLIELIAQNLNKKIYLVNIPFFEFLLKVFIPSLHQKLFQNLTIDNSRTLCILNSKNPANALDGIKIMMQNEH